MKPFIAVLLLWWILLVNCSETLEDCVVRLEEGFVRGIKETTVLGKEFYSFLRLPYAKPPVGYLRFKDPVAVESWDGVFNSTYEPEVCLQSPLFDEMKQDKAGILTSGTEDCLYMKIYSTKPNGIYAMLPVMVFIHGGGFVDGGGQEYHPYFLLNEQIVLVVLQYRLNIFGFLSTEDSLLPGNMGLKDQQLALKWIRRNILNFGGDPNKVTIFGQSAGGASVHMHLLSPGSKGLFSRAIMQSGTSLCPWATNENHREFAEQAGIRFQCPLKDGTDSYLKCMQKIDAKLLFHYFEERIKWGNFPLLMVPRVDGSFLPEKPEILLKKGKYHKVDMMLGITRDEGALFSLDMCVNPKMLEDLTSNFEETGPVSLFIESEPHSEKLAAEIYEHYLQNKKIKPDEPQMVKLYTDWYFGVCNDIASIFHASDDEVSVYLYQLDHVGQYSLTDLIPHCERNNWVAHCDELFYLFNGGIYFSQPLERKEDIKLQKIIISLWTNFAKTGNPTPSGSDFSWEKATLKNFKHLSLRPEPRMMNDNMRDVRKFWLSRKIRQMSNVAADERLNVPDEEAQFETKQNEEL